jgi:hypothetical protein
VTAQIEALQAALTARLDDPQKLVEELTDEIAPKLQPTIQPVGKWRINRSERLPKIQSKFDPSDREESGGLRAYVSGCDWRIWRHL